jgi:hypothetical protein
VEKVVVVMVEVGPLVKVLVQALDLKVVMDSLTLVVVEVVLDLIMIQPISQVEQVDLVLSSLRILPK